MRTIRTQENEERFLNALRECPNVTEACQKIGLSRNAFYEWKKDDEEFSKRWEEALSIGMESLEDEIYRRAVTGWEEPVFYQGKKTGRIRKYSDTLLIFCAKAHNPAKYRERSDVNLTATAGTGVMVVSADSSTEDWQEAAAGAMDRQKDLEKDLIE